MPNVYRVGLVTGVIGGLTLVALGRVAGLLVAPGVIVVGAIAGLAIAKWLEWGWFGRQTAAGLRAGLIACVLASIFALVTLFTVGPHSAQALVEQSHLGPLTMAPTLRPLSAAGWAGIDLLFVLAACLLGALLSTALTRILASGKNDEAVRTVNQARLAAEALRRGVFGMTSTSMPALPNSLAVGTHWQTGAHSVPLATRATGRPAAPVEHEEYPVLYDDEPALPPPPARKSTGAPKSRKTAVPPPEPEPEVAPNPDAMNYLDDENRLREAMREALSMWADETEENPDSQPTQVTPRKRTAQPSTFLNENAAQPKSKRKKTNTRDWLC